MLACFSSNVGLRAVWPTPTATVVPMTAPAVPVVSPDDGRVVHAIFVPCMGPGDAGVYPLVGPSLLLYEEAIKHAYWGRRK